MTATILAMSIVFFTHSSNTKTTTTMSCTSISISSYLILLFDSFFLSFSQSYPLVYTSHNDIDCCLDYDQITRIILLFIWTLSKFLITADPEDSEFRNLLEKVNRVALDFTQDAEINIAGNSTYEMPLARRIINQERWTTKDGEGDKNSSGVKFYDEETLSINDGTIILPPHYQM